ncbi:hypothetical protein Sfum_0026 [Syntrophobacter fumaroxidans MPOB]|uniref:Uncharacterized protein n=1 Tax=Syntrophobacter fumaroxidans (strain DSM 10017 / MPOB) TaxID=335543 RepID=A0LE77_SYNFM|nr:hypothetical protein Sfum_0026 [Syntrophobacter fumaroxidans MPOB]
MVNGDLPYRIPQAVSGHSAIRVNRRRNRHAVSSPAETRGTPRGTQTSPPGPSTPPLRPLRGQRGKKTGTREKGRLRHWKPGLTCSPFRNGRHARFQAHPAGRRKSLRPGGSGSDRSFYPKSK